MAEKKLVIENLESFEELKEDDFSEISGGLLISPDYEIPDILPDDGEKPVLLPDPKPYPYPNPYPCKPWNPKPLPVESSDGIIAIPCCCYAIL